MSDILGGSAGTVQTQSSQTPAPWSGVAPYLSQGLASASGLYSGNPSGFNWNPNAAQTQGFNTGINAATNPGGLVNQGISTYANAMNPANINPASNPAFVQATNQALGAAGSAFEGQYGGAAGNNLNNSGYQQNLATGLGNAATTAYSNQYNQNMSNALNAASGSSALQNANANQLLSLGGQEQQLAYNQSQAPWSQLQNYNAALNPGLGLSSTSGTATTPYFTNPLGSAAGAALGGASLYNSGALNGLGSLFGGGGSAFSPTAAFGGLGDTGALGIAGATLGGTDFASMLAGGILAL